jgi:hypothetical protein
MGGSFLGTAAAAAAGVVGGSLLMGGLRSMMGGGHAHAAFDPPAGAPRSGSPWSGGNEGGDLSRQAGLEDMGRPSGLRGGDDGNTRAGLFDTASRDPVTDDYNSDVDAMSDESDDFGDDYGDGDFGADDGGE